uniref:Uncharacterized protein n=1 Tax=Branchiostoma floridae TaxID=7739 RepID=C3ZAV6_BRAFL|eukprot:XP_002593982.1 hypothetical protein BRAFLDRAFT_68580 [Branchiostoma floridae]
MESKLTWAISVCLVTLALLYLVAPGESQTALENACAYDFLTVQDGFGNDIECDEQIGLDQLGHGPPFVQYAAAQQVTDLRRHLQDLCIATSSSSTACNQARTRL